MPVRDGEKGPIEVEVVKRRVVAKIERKIGPEEMLVVIRGLDEEKNVKTDYHLSSAAGHPLGRVRPGGECRAPHRRVYQACQERGGHGPVPSAQLVGVAPSYHAMPDSDLVLGVRDAAGEKSGRQRSPCRKSAKGSPRSFTVPAAATRPSAYDENASVG